ncbi:MAG: LysE family translocator [Pseudomonadota bacterium]
MPAILAIDPWTWAAFLAAGVALLLTPGPNMMFCIACGLRGGPKAGVAAGMGAATGMFLHGALVAVGLASLIAANPVAFEVIRYGGAAYLIWLGWQAWRAGDDLEERLGRREIARAYGRALITNLTNPKVLVFMIALLPQFADPAIGPVWPQILAFGAVLALMAAVFDGLYGGLAGALSARVRRAAGFMNKLSALVFGGLAVRILAE